LLLLKRLQKQLRFSAVWATIATKTSISAGCTADSLLFSGNKTPVSAKAIELKEKVDINIKPAINNLLSFSMNTPLDCGLNISVLAKSNNGQE